MLNYMDRQTLIATKDYIDAEFGESASSYGFTNSSFAVAFALGALTFGWMADRWNIFWIYPGAVVVWSLAGFLTGFVQGWAGLMACRFLLGLAEAGHWPCSLRTTQHLLPPAKRTLGNGILQSGAAVGAIITPFVVLQLVHRSEDWPYPFWVVGSLGLFWVLLWFCWVRPRDLATPRASMTTGAGAPAETAMSPRSSLHFLADRRYWVLVVVVVSINTAWHFFLTWLPPFLKDLGYEWDDAIRFTAAYFLSADAGSLLVGFATLFIIGRGIPVHRARVLMFGACAVLTSLGVVVALMSKGLAILVLLLIIAFGSLGLFPNYYSFTQEITVRHQGKVTGTLSCINWLAVATLHGAVGLVVEWTGIHAIGMMVASLAPLVGLAALVFFWKGPAEKVKALGP
jgi:ACS family hexuronate transporter-like MFS transporter